MSNARRKDKIVPCAAQHVFVRERLRTFRRLRNLRQGDMASRMGISRPAYAELEHPNRDIRLSTLFRIAEALEVPAYTLLVGVDEAAAALENDVRAPRKREVKYRERTRAALVKQFGEAAVAQAEKDVGPKL